MKIIDLKAAKKKLSREQALRAMRIALVIAVGLITGAIVIVVAGQSILTMVIWLLQLALFCAFWGVVAGGIALAMNAVLAGAGFGANWVKEFVG